MCEKAEILLEFASAVKMYLKPIIGTAEYLVEIAEQHPEREALCLELLERYATMSKIFNEITNMDSLRFSD